VQGTRWRATPNAHQRKDQTVKISAKREETTRQGWLIFTAVNWLSFIALQTSGGVAIECIVSGCGITAAGRVANERGGSNGRIVIAIGVL
jgi:hypothetical protein